VYLPNIFGEHGRPFYNSVVATFSHQLAHSESPTIMDDREIPLLHAQDAVESLLDALDSDQSSVMRLSGNEMKVSEVLDRLTLIHERYLLGQLPNLADPFTRALFNTYRSFTFPQMWPIYPPAHHDERGELFEAVRGLGGEAQVFFSHTNPGFTRGNHFHLRKVERFLVMQGSAVIRLRRMFTEQVVEFHVSGTAPAILDMPTLWTHAITNTGGEDLLTLFYADDEFNPADPDTYWISV
jgi:UDP-2-acetamido-2,6-beta-L-arabino-hexul-4-ose reductase